MPNWLGAIDSGPLRESAYCRPIRTFPMRLLACSFNVAVLLTLNTVRI